MPLYAIDGKQPVVGTDVWVAPSADVIGDAHLADESSIWFGAVIRADNTPIIIGTRSNIQESAMCHSDPGSPLTVGADCTIGHHAILHGCTIGNNVLIGMGAIILNNAVIGDGCIVGAGALVTEGKTFEPNSLIVGSPAKAIRTLDEKAAAMLKASAQHYVDKGKAYTEGLTRVG
jgi:carbonic anhydrase/acetyltransferase-like protein (isoleucine patch superfamily)